MKKRVRKKTSKPRKLDPKAFAIATLRRATYRWPPREEARRRNKTDRNQYKCELCQKGGFKRNETKIDHINPVVPVTGWDGFDGFITRLLCMSEGFQLLCNLCHSKKTKSENEKRKFLRSKLG